MLASKSILGRQDPSKIGAKLDPINSYFEVQVGFHVGGILAARGRRRTFFWRLQQASQNPSKMRPPEGFGRLVGASKKCPLAPQPPPPRWSPTWTPKKQCIAPKLGSVLAPMLAPKIKIIEFFWVGRNHGRAMAGAGILAPPI